MAKEVVINTSGLNSYGSRVLTDGLDTTQYQKNPVLLWMHRRYGDNCAPIGRMENLRIDGDRLIGTPVFDLEDDFAKKIANKWDKGFLNMCSASVEILETSTDPQHLIQGQSRATVTRGKLLEVSIVDIGSNDDALKLMNSGKLLELSAGEASPLLPLLELSNTDNSVNSNIIQQTKMKKETLLILGLPETATEEQVHDAIVNLNKKAEQVETLQLANVAAAVDAAIADRRITSDKRDHFINLGKAAGFQSLTETLNLMQPTRKPTDVLDLSNDNAGKQQPTGKQEYAKLSDVPEDKLLELRKDNPKEYARLYKQEYGIECPVIKD